MYGQPRRDLSVFPLGIVAVPSEGVPLHIFEDRYLRMIEDCLGAPPGSPARAFGIVWLSDQELKQIGCACEVERVLERTSDGRMNILARANTPFRLLERREDLPYPAGVVEFLGDVEEEADEGLPRGAQHSGRSARPARARARDAIAADGRPSGRSAARTTRGRAGPRAGARSCR